MRNAGSAVTRIMFPEHVWDINFDTYTNVRDIHINYLRKKIDKGHKPTLINFLRGRGFILTVYTPL